VIIGGMIQKWDFGIGLKKLTRRRNEAKVIACRFDPGRRCHPGTMDHRNLEVSGLQPVNSKPDKKGASL